MSGSPVQPAALSADAAAIKACCSAAYGNDLVAVLLGESYHPGGKSLTRRLAGYLGIGSGGHILDVAAGPGTTALLLAEEFGARVTGVELSPRLVARAQATATERQLDTANFIVADAEQLPLTSNSVDSVICECALSTFPGKVTALVECRRVLKPGGRLGLTDVTLDVNRLDDQLRTLTGYAACLGGALTVEQYGLLLADAGFRIIRSEQHDDAMVRMIGSIEARIKALSILGLNPSSGVPIDPERVFELAAAAARCLDEGIAGYHLFVAERI